MDITAPHTLNHTQYKVLMDNHRVIMYSGGYGCGKTLLGCYWSIMQAINVPKSTGMIMSPTLKMLNDNILEPHLISLLNDLLGVGRWKFHKDTKEYYIKLFNGSIIRLRGFADETTIRGSDVNWIWLDEAIGKDQIYLTDKRFKQIRARLRRGTKQQMLITTNPGAQSHFLYKFFIKNATAAKNRVVHFSRMRDNRHLGDEYLKDMEETYEDDELAGQWSLNVGAVYHEFNHTKHVVENLKEKIAGKDGDYYLAIDWGYNNPFVCLLIFVDKDNQIYILEEIFRTQTTIDLLATEVGSRFVEPYDINSGVADPEEPANIRYFKTHLEINLRKGINKINSGITAVKKLLMSFSPTQALVQVDSSCINLIDEFGAYPWEPAREGVNEKEEPIKFMDHGLDALRYFVMTIYNRRIVRE